MPSVRPRIARKNEKCAYACEKMVGSSEETAGRGGLAVSSLYMKYGQSQVLLKDSTLQLKPGGRYGLIGRNGEL
eukprot:SAG22_NODE_2858_length_2152_cov_1.417925_2_plen_74_part_00